jgi:hypothetical protein
MSKLVVLAALGGAAALVYTQLPEIQRYIKIKQM